MENHNDSPAIQTNGDIGVDRIMELDPGPMENDNNASNSNDPENSITSTMCYDLIPSYLVSSNHVISPYQQGHQAFLLVKLKDNTTNALDNAYHSLLPMVLIHLDHASVQNPALHSHPTLFDHFHDMHAFKQQASSHQYGEISFLQRVSQ
jgi:hypothetical protein